MAVSASSYRNLVGGDWVDAVDGATMQVLNPATAEPLAEVPSCTTVDVDRAVGAAVRALPGWLETTPRERSELLLALAAVLEEHADELGALESQNVGKPLAAARAELPEMADNLRFFAGAGRLLEGRSTGEYARGRTDPPRAGRRRGGYRPLELPALDGGLEAGAGVGSRERAGSEAV